MASFVDATGETWTVRIDVAALRRIKELAHVDLRVIDSGKSLLDLANDPLTLVAVLYAALQPQIEKRDLSEVQFAERFAGDVLDGAADALVEEIIHFFPQRQRPGLAKIWNGTKLGIDEAFRLAEQVMEPDEIRRRVDQAVRKVNVVTTLNDSSGNVPASSVSTPTDSHSAN